ncbi:anthrax toxin receptor 1-like isoform X2 [Corticium candelabrum]|uniref:anthrax toxin receptor 1-like isoform X2 n=1 Tax=Corticium candelabrum TaxID=121492 RepID=UPI002E260B1A|nr:anthrax toxin receptor 1-like isoform X2 [Corticium candelabrum]
MRVMYVSCLLTLLAVFSSLHQATATDLKPCRGAFDLVFVLDKSGSVGPLFASSTVEFVKNVSSYFVSPLLGISFITFADDGELHLSLTSDRIAVDGALANLSKIEGSGGTFMATGLEKAVQQIQKKRDRTVTVILVLTDGQDSDINEAIVQANKARRLGAVLYAVGVADFSHEQLELVADQPVKDHVFEASRFDDLPTLVDGIVNKTCIEILSATPTELCSEGNHSIVINGNGFTRGRTASDILCNFHVNATLNYVTIPKHPVQDARVVCNSPTIPRNERGIILQISVNNGNSYVSSNVTLDVVSCESSSPNAALIIALIAIALILLLLLLWWFWPLCVGGVESEPDVEEVEKQPPRNVSASYYGGRGAGGISAMRVDWGDRGSTKEGSKLTPAKDAKITEPPPRPPAKEPGCGDRIKSAFAGCWAAVVAKYVYVASFRPVRRRSYRPNARKQSTASNKSLVSSKENGSTSNPPVTPTQKSAPTASQNKSVRSPSRSTTGSTSKAPPPPRPKPPAQRTSSSS